MATDSGTDGQRTAEDLNNMTGASRGYDHVTEDILHGLYVQCMGTTFSSPPCYPVYPPPRPYRIAIYQGAPFNRTRYNTCLLYTSDAADE